MAASSRKQSSSPIYCILLSHVNNAVSDSCHVSQIRATVARLLHIRHVLICSTEPDETSEVFLNIWLCMNNGWGASRRRLDKQQEDGGVRTVGYTFILDLQVFVGSRARVWKHIWSGHDSTLRPVITSEKQERKDQKVGKKKISSSLFLWMAPVQSSTLVRCLACA